MCVYALHRRIMLLHAATSPSTAAVLIEFPVYLHPRSYVAQHNGPGEAFDGASGNLIDYVSARVRAFKLYVSGVEMASAPPLPPCENYCINDIARCSSILCLYVCRCFRE